MTQFIDYKAYNMYNSRTMISIHEMTVQEWDLGPKYQISKIKTEQNRLKQHIYFKCLFGS